MAKDFVVFLRRVVTPGYARNDCAVRERKLRFPVGLDRFSVPQNGADIVEAAFFAGYGDKPPVAVSGWNFGYEDRRGPSSAFRDGGAVKATTPASVANAPSKKVIRFIWLLSQNRISV